MAILGSSTITDLNVLGDLKKGGVNVSLEGHTHSYQAAGTYVTASSATSTETSLTTSSDAKVPTSKAVATYVTGLGYKTTDNDTKNTAGSTDTSSKIFLIGATSQGANPQTYSHDTAYVGTDGCLYSGGNKVLTSYTEQYTGTVKKVNNTSPDANGNVTISIPSAYSLPTATSSRLGGIKVGGNLSITNDGVLSVTGGVGGEPVGIIIMCMSNQVPTGYVPLTGGDYNKTTYSDLWSFAQNKGLTKTLSEWNTLNVSQNGNVPYYASVDSSTFRVPNISGYVKGGNANSEYVEAGLPNITGEIGVDDRVGHGYITGAFYNAGTQSQYNTSAGSGDSSPWPITGFDASRSNSIYGNSDTVQPEGITVIFAVKAFHSETNTSNLDLQQAIQSAQNSVVKLKVW